MVLEETMSPAEDQQDGLSCLTNLKRSEDSSAALGNTLF